MKVFIFCIFLVFLNLRIYCQISSDTVYLKNLFVQNEDTVNYYRHLKNSFSEIDILVSFSYLIYKKYISSQDVDACVFYPSCSTYTIEAIDKKGFIKGLLEGFDRLLRCHP